jgi:enoyl-CoA hydratase/carnithine racemase
MNVKLNTLSFCLNDGIGHLIMNQPPSNEMTLEFFSELGILVGEMKKMKALKAIIISGEGRHFSSGAALDQLLSLVDIEFDGDLQKNDGRLMDFLNRNYDSFLYFEQADIPVISAIRGACLGSAFELSLFSHFRFCGEDSVLGLPETTFGLLPGIGGISGVAALAGKSIAMELILRGNTFNAEEALTMNLIDGIFPKKQVVPSATDFAKSIMTNYRKEKKKLYLKSVALHKASGTTR